MSFANNEAAEMYAELLAYRNQLQAELNQDSYFLNQLKSQSADPKAKDKNRLRGPGSARRLSSGTS